MAKKRQLTQKQIGVIDDLFDGQMVEQAILQKHRLRRTTYYKWLSEDNFKEQFGLRIAALNRHSELIIASYASLAVAKLVELTGSGEVETARRACLDIINLPREDASKVSAKSTPKNKDGEQLAISNETASRVLAALADSGGENKGTRQPVSKSLG